MGTILVTESPVAARIRKHSSKQPLRSQVALSYVARRRQDARNGIAPYIQVTNYRLDISYFVDTLSD